MKRNCFDELDDALRLRSDLQRGKKSKKVTGPAKVSFVSPSDVAKLSAPQKELFYDRASALSERILQLIHGIVVRKDAEVNSNQIDERRERGMEWVPRLVLNAESTLCCDASLRPKSY